MDLELLYQVATTGALYIGRSWIRFTIVCGGSFLLFWVVFAERFAHRRCQPTVPDRAVHKQEARNSMLGIVYFLTPLICSLPLFFSGHLKVILDPTATHPAMMLLSFVLFVIGADTWFYWVHRLLHHSSLYAAAHELHHAAEQPSPLSGYAFAFIEGILLGLFLPLVLLVVPINVVVLAVFTEFFALTEAYVHLGYELLPRRLARNPVGKFLGTSVFHNMHHENGAFNFGVYFTWWDRIMGTIHPEYTDRYEQVTATPLWAKPQSDAGLLK